MRFGSLWIPTLALLLAACGDKAPAESETTKASVSESATDGEGTTSAATEAATESASSPSSPSSPSDPNPSDPNPSDPNPTTGEPGTGGFIVMPDGGVAGQCDPKQQDCPEDEKCSAVSDTPGEPWGLNKCVPKTGDSQVGDPCDIVDGKYTGLDNCDVGLICLLTDDEGLGGACVEFCDVSDQCPKTGAKCVVYNDGSLPICLVDCDPLIQDCPEGQACYNSAGDAFVCFKESAMPGEGAPGDECSYINQCQKGSFCANPASLSECGAQSGCCTPYCPVDGGNEPCNPGEDCVVFFVEGMAPPGYENVGVCVVPE